MNRDNLLAQLETLPAATSGRLFPTVYTAGVPTKWLMRFGVDAPTGTADADFYIQTGGTTTTTKLWGNVNGTWTAVTVA